MIPVCKLSAACCTSLSRCCKCSSAFANHFVRFAKVFWHVFLFLRRAGAACGTSANPRTAPADACRRFARGDRPYFSCHIPSARSTPSQIFSCPSRARRVRRVAHSDPWIARAERRVIFSLRRLAERPTPWGPSWPVCKCLRAICTGRPARCWRRPGACARFFRATRQESVQRPSFRPAVAEPHWRG